MKSLNLGALDNLEQFAAKPGFGGEQTGKPLMINISDVIADPGQPRKKMNKKKLEELAASIQQRGVKTPISVKPANEDGKYIINHGERRYRASILAGKVEIPAFIDNGHDDIDQLVENIQREDLSPFEAARAVAKALQRLSVTEVAKESGKSKTWVSRYKAISEAPECFQAAAEKFGDATALSDLLTAYKERPEEIEAFLRGAGEEISRADVLLFLRPPATKSETVTPPVSNATTSNGPTTAPGTVDPSAPQNQHRNADSGTPPSDNNSTPVVNQAKPAATGQGETKGASTNSGMLDLDGIYEKHAAGTPIDALLSALKPADLEALGKPLVKLAKQGKSTTNKDLYSVLVGQLRAGQFATSGAGLYRMHAFLHGKLESSIASPADQLVSTLHGAENFVTHGSEK